MSANDRVSAAIPRAKDTAEATHQSVSESSIKFRMTVQVLLGTDVIGSASRTFTTTAEMLVSPWSKELPPLAELIQRALDAAKKRAS